MLQWTNFPQVPEVSYSRPSPSILWKQFHQSFFPAMLLWKGRGSLKINMSKVWCLIVRPIRISLLPWNPSSSWICSVCCLWIKNSWLFYLKNSWLFYLIRSLHFHQAACLGICMLRTYISRIANHIFQWTNSKNNPFKLRFLSISILVVYCVNSNDINSMIAWLLILVMRTKINAFK